MQSKHPNPVPYGRKQRGAALFMALIFLLILTVLGVFGMNLSRMENQMAGNAQFQTEALNNAEYILIAAEADINAMAKGVFPNPFLTDVAGDQYYASGVTDFNSTASGTQQPSDLVWDFDHASISLPDLNGDGSDTNGDSTADDGTGMYTIQYAGRAEEDGAADDTAHRLMGAGPPGAIVDVFLVTAQSSSSRGAKRILQSVLVRGQLW